MEYLIAFLVGGAICLVGQVLIDYTKLTPARILTGFVVTGVILSALGLYGPLAEFAGAGATVPIVGFGHLLYTGVKEAVAERGLHITEFVMKMSSRLSPTESSSVWRFSPDLSP